jgi:protein-tyrosine-phosphatase
MTERKVRILFVCVENSNRSQMAQAFAALYGGDRVEALSAGSRPGGCGEMTNAPPMPLQ